MNALTIVYAVVNRQMALRYPKLLASLEANDREGAVEILASILKMFNDMPEKSYQYEDMKDRCREYYKGCLKLLADNGIELDESFFAIRGEAISLSD